MEYKWRERKRTILGLPLSFTVYRLTEEKLLVDTGFFNINQEEVRLYRIFDVTLKRSFVQRIFGLGTIHCCSADKTTPEFDIQNIKNSEKIKEMLSDMIEIQRQKKKVTGRELMMSEEEDMDLDSDS